MGAPVRVIWNAFLRRRINSSSSAGTIGSSPADSSSNTSRVYLFRGEYIFEVEKTLVVETPQIGHATYVFSRPRNVGSFLALYIKISKEHIRRNRDNADTVIEVVHGTNPRARLKEMQQCPGEKVDFPLRAPTTSLTDLQHPRRLSAQVRGEV